MPTTFLIDRINPRLCASLFTCLCVFVASCGKEEEVTPPPPPPPEVPVEEESDPQKVAIGIVDMERLYFAIPEARALEQRIAERDREIALRRMRHAELLGQYEALVRIIKDPELPENLREKNRQIAERKAQELKVLDSEMQPGSNRRADADPEPTDAEQKAEFVKTLSGFVEEVAEEEGLDIVFDKGAAHGENNLPHGLGYSRGSDITDLVLQRMGVNP